jgi:hypothetical protein
MSRPAHVPPEPTRSALSLSPVRAKIDDVAPPSRGDLKFVALPFEIQTNDKLEAARTGNCF